MPKALPPRVRSASSDLSTGDFEAIRDAVMETARGRWFLDEFASRLRTAETADLLDGMKRLENSVAANHDALMARLADALSRDNEDDGIKDALSSEADGMVAELAPRHMKFYRADEDIFEPAPQAMIGAVAEPSRPVLVEADAPPVQPTKQRIVIIRHKAGEQINVPLMPEDFAKAS
jgi:hypothetical protein